MSYSFQIKVNLIFSSLTELNKKCNFYRQKNTNDIKEKKKSKTFIFLIYLDVLNKKKLKNQDALENLIFEEMDENLFFKKKSEELNYLEDFFKVNIPKNEMFGFYEIQENSSLRKTKALIYSPTAILLGFNINFLKKKHQNIMKNIINSEIEKFLILNKIRKRFNDKLRNDPNYHKAISNEEREEKRKIKEMKFLQSFVKGKKLTNLSHFNLKLDTGNIIKGGNIIPKSEYFTPKNSSIFKLNTPKKLYSLSIEKKQVGDHKSSSELRNLAVLKTTLKESPSLKLYKLKNKNLSFINKQTSKLIEDKKLQLEKIEKSEKTKKTLEREESLKRQEKSKEAEEESEISWFHFSKKKKKNKWTVRDNSKDYLSMLELRSPFYNNNTIKKLKRDAGLNGKLNEIKSSRTISIRNKNNSNREIVRIFTFKSQGIEEETDDRVEKKFVGIRSERSRDERLPLIKRFFTPKNKY